MEDKLKKELIEYLSTFVTQERLELLEQKINQRTQQLTLVIEDVFQSRNISAIIRSADCLGIQDIHVIENKNKFILDKTVSAGSGKWTHIIRHNNKKNNTKNCINNLKKEGYQIIATTPHNTNISLEEINIRNNKIAILLGTELTGLSNEAIKLSDKRMGIKMVGFTESLNISVCAAICSYHLIDRMKKETSSWRIKKEARLNIMLNWLRNSIKSSSKIEKKFLRENEI